MNVNLDLLRQRIKTFESGNRAHQLVLPLGISEIDAVLPDGGLRLGAVHEIVTKGKAAATGFCAILAAKLSSIRGPILWCLPQVNLSPQGLSAFGLDPKDVFFVPFSSQKEGLWALEEGLKGSGIAAVVAEGLNFNLTVSRRLYLKAMNSGVTALLLLSELRKSSMSNVASTRWRISSSHSTDAPSALSFQGIGNIRLSVELLRVKGGMAPHSWVITWDEHAQSLSLDCHRVAQQQLTEASDIL